MTIKKVLKQGFLFFLIFVQVQIIKYMLEYPEIWDRLNQYLGGLLRVH